MQTNELLKALGGISGIRPRTDQTPTGQAAVSGSFDELLDKAREGAITTDSAVKIAKGLSITLTPDQLRRAAAAADVAEANGASRAMILLDGRAYRMDVSTRTIIGEAQSSRTPAMSDVDAVVAAPASDEELAARPVKINPPSGAAIDVSNTALRQLLESSGNAA